jgi:hypothetical protein
MKNLYINENGRTACSNHGGFYLTHAIKENPTAAEYDTPADNWVRLSAKDLAEFDLSCETCGHN